MYFDSHAHFDDERVLREYPGGTEAMIKDTIDAGVHNVVNIGTNLENSKTSIELATNYDFIYASVGIYPSEATHGEDGRILFSGREPESVLGELEELLANPKVVAIGEIGLDYQYGDTDREAQLELFEYQMLLAEKYSKPVVIHDRDAHGDTFDIISRHPRVIGVMHSYSAGAEMARQLCNKGWYISFSGPLTYKNANKVKEAAGIVPLDRIMAETDSPYLPPTPHRGEINYPGYVSLTVEAIAEIRGITKEEAARITSDNAKRLFGIK